jgi:hypothetical protein
MMTPPFPRRIHSERAHLNAAKIAYCWEKPMSKIITTALAAGCLGLVVQGASAAGPFGVWNLSGTYVIQAHGFENDNSAPTDTGENAILGLVTFNGAGGVTGVGFSFTHNDSFATSDALNPSAETINCSVQITGGAYAVNTVTGAGAITMNLIKGVGFPGGSPVCTTLSSPASLTFAFVLNDTDNGLVTTSAPVQLINFTPGLNIGGPPPSVALQIINGMNLQGTLRLR